MIHYTVETVSAEVVRDIGARQIARILARRERGLIQRHEANPGLGHVYHIHVWYWRP